MEREMALDTLDQNILRILSLYEGLAVGQLWYEIGEDDATVENVTKEEVLSRLEFLRRRGLVKCMKEQEGDVKWTVKKG